MVMDSNISVPQIKSLVPQSGSFKPQNFVNGKIQQQKVQDLFDI